MSGVLDFEQIVEKHYAPLYRFALSLTHVESDARDLTQQTFLIWATKGYQLQDASKVKTWLFTTLHREFLHLRRRENRFPHQDLEAAGNDLPWVPPEAFNQMDGQTMIQLLARIDELFQAPVALYYLEDYSYKEIGDILQIPLGTVKSRISRGLAQLQAQILDWHESSSVLRKETP